ncbi:MAG: hypothetical protein ACI837_002095 [Crocinitomicaceae bacterium]|jgi:hypothetical protein
MAIRNYKLIILFAFLAPTVSFSQSLRIEEYNGSIHLYNISNLEETTFDNTSMYVNLSAAGSDTYLLADVKNFQYTNGIESLADVFTALSISNTEIYPNPADEIITVKYFLNADARMRIELYSMNGQLVKQIYEEDESPGEHLHTYNASDLNGGTYLLIISANSDSFTERLIIN